jgi:hypothetical protein
MAETLRDGRASVGSGSSLGEGPETRRVILGEFCVVPCRTMQGWRDWRVRAQCGTWGQWVVDSLKCWLKPHIRGHPVLLSDILLFRRRRVWDLS